MEYSFPASSLTISSYAYSSSVSGPQRFRITAGDEDVQALNHPARPGNRTNIKAMHEGTYTFSAQPTQIRLFKEATGSFGMGNMFQTSYDVDGGNGTDDFGVVGIRIGNNYNIARQAFEGIQSNFPGNLMLFIGFDRWKWTVTSSDGIVRADKLTGNGAGGPVTSIVNSQPSPAIVLSNGYTVVDGDTITISLRPENENPTGRPSRIAHLEGYFHRFVTFDIPSVTPPALPDAAAVAQEATTALDGINASAVQAVADLASFSNATTTATNTTTAVAAVVGDTTFAAKPLEEKENIITKVAAQAVTAAVNGMEAASDTDKRTALRDIMTAALSAASSASVTKIELNTATFKRLIAVDEFEAGAGVTDALNTAPSVKVVAAGTSLELSSEAVYCPLATAGDICDIEVSDTTVRFTKNGNGTTTPSIVQGSGVLSTTDPMSSGDTGSLTTGAVVTYFIAGSTTVVPGVPSGGASGDPFISTLF